VSKNKILRNTAKPWRKDVTKYSRKLHNEGLHNVYSLPRIVKTVEVCTRESSGSANQTSEMEVEQTYTEE
jgi:hypothetical protein